MMMARKKTGMTLVEIMFAFAIVSTVLTLAYAAALSAWRTATSSNQRTQAQYLVQQSLEAIKAYRESADFSWGDFVDDMGGVGSGFHIVLEADGVAQDNTFVCPPTATACVYNIVSGPDNNLASVGSNASVPDATVFTLTITPEEHYVANSDVATTGAPPAPGDDVTAITLVARITWTSTQGINSNLAASTIITEPR